MGELAGNAALTELQPGAPHGAAATPEATAAPGRPTPLEAFTEAHLHRLESITHLRAQPAADEVQRGFAAQQVLRELEQSIRQGVLDFCHQAAELGVRQKDMSAWLTLASRTLRHWEHEWRHGGLAVRARGRRLVCSDPEQLNAVVTWLHQLGPATGLAVLQGEFPEMTRAELHDVLRCYRQAWQGQHQRVQHVLHWQEPGRVWAMDYAEAPCRIDGCYRYVLAVRDLASGQQLLWLPMTEATAQSTIARLALLFASYGPPLVLKSDNGSPFSAGDTRDFLEHQGVWPLFSPPRTPSYNGSCEAAIGSMKKRTTYQAARNGPAGEWTGADVDTARQQGNETARPRGPKGPTPAEAWRQRVDISPAERHVFAETVARLQVDVRQAREVPLDQELGHRDEAAVQREVLRRALVAHGYLLFRRRRIPLPIRPPKAAKIR